MAGLAIIFKGQYLISYSTSGELHCIIVLKISRYSTLGEVLKFVEAQLDRSRAVRVIYSIADVAKIREYRERLNHAMHQFGVCTASGRLAQLMKADDRNISRLLRISSCMKR